MDAVVAVLAVGAVRATSMASVLGSAAASIGITRVSSGARAKIL
jgi:hypothetical protein